jgi:hypothetical protein
MHAGQPFPNRLQKPAKTPCINSQNHAKQPAPTTTSIRQTMYKNFTLQIHIIHCTTQRGYIASFSIFFLYNQTTHSSFQIPTTPKNENNAMQSPQNILPTNPSLPSQPDKITLSTLLPGRVRFDAMDLFKQPLQSVLQIFVFRALVEFAQEVSACDQTVVAESESRHAEVLFWGRGRRGVWLVNVFLFSSLLLVCIFRLWYFLGKRGERGEDGVEMERKGKERGS